MLEEIQEALDAIAAFAKRYEPLDGHFVVEQKGGRQRGRHIYNGQRIYIRQSDFDRVRKSCQAGDILRLLRQVKTLIEELDRDG